MPQGDTECLLKAHQRRESTIAAQDERSIAGSAVEALGVIEFDIEPGGGERLRRLLGRGDHTLGKSGVITKVKERDVKPVHLQRLAAQLLVFTQMLGKLTNSRRGLGIRVDRKEQPVGRLSRRVAWMNAD